MKRKRPSKDPVFQKNKRRCLVQIIQKTVAITKAIGDLHAYTLLHTQGSGLDHLLKSHVCLNAYLKSQRAAFAEPIIIDLADQDDGDEESADTSPPTDRVKTARTPEKKKKKKKKKHLTTIQRCLRPPSNGIHRKNRP